MWEGAPEVSLVQLSCPLTRSPKSGCLRPCPVGIWVSSIMDTIQPLQKTCSHVQPPLLKENFFSSLNYISCVGTAKSKSKEQPKGFLAAYPGEHSRFKTGVLYLQLSLLHLVQVPSSLKPLGCWLILGMTLPFGYVSVCQLPEEPRSVLCPSSATVPGAACAQPCGPVTHQGAFLAVGAAARPCPTLQRLHQHVQEGTFHFSFVPASKHNTFPADHYWDAPGKRPILVGRQRQGSKAVGRKWGKSREALWLFLPL